MKYIIIKKRGIEMPILFSEIMSHANVASPANGEVVSAGFCSIYRAHDDVDVACYGESVTLKLKSRGEADAEVIKKHIEFKF